MPTNNSDRITESRLSQPSVDDDEGGLRAPPDLRGWRKAWWWFHFLILVKLARLRFIAILLLIGFVITQWDTLAAHYEKWTRPANAVASGGSDVEYFCPMHPSIIRDNPKDKCPICFMPLSKRKKGAAQAEALPAGIVNRVQLSPYRVVLAGIKTWPVDYEPLTKEITAVGYVEFDERGQKTVSARVKGRIDKLIANETGEMVNAGDELALLYSPELFVTVQNLIDAQRNDNQSLVANVRTRLELLGIDDAQINEILKSGKPNTHLTIRSPISGHVITKYVREGQYVEEGMPLYDLADLSTVWIQAQVYEDDLPFLTVGSNSAGEMASSDRVEVAAATRAFHNELFKGKLAFIYPHVDQDTRTVTVRLELDNPDHKLRPGSTATVTLKVKPEDLHALGSIAEDAKPRELISHGRILAVPESTVIDTGSQRIVYRESSPNVYDGVEVKLGPGMSGPGGAIFYPVLKGLKHGDRVVTSGSFLVDAETRLNPAAGSIYFGGSGGSQAKGGSVTTVRPTTPEDPDAKIEASLAGLSPEDRQLAESQQFCPVLPDSRLGSMGVPVTLVIEGKPVFVCCPACTQKALANPQKVLAAVAKLRSGGAKMIDEASDDPDSDTTTEADPEADIQEALAELSPEDRRLAEPQRFCAVLTKNRLGSMGPPVKLVIEGKPTFLCCDGCRAKALANPQRTIESAAKLSSAPSAQKR
ncbi:MAG: efflux RND transporter periplasmic adaptor subunit [Pirellulales bacterium]|nr:efflux RND transporter periplasmic adaptor subunit [Pirellulales bacterium]